MKHAAVYAKISGNPWIGLSPPRLPSPDVVIIQFLRVNFPLDKLRARLKTTQGDFQ